MTILYGWTFDNDIEGWSERDIKSDASPQSATLSTQGGALVAYDDGDPTLPVFCSPASLSGDQSSIFGTKIEINWENDAVGSSGEIGSYAIKVVGQDGSSIQIRMDIPDTRASQVTGKFEAVLDPSVVQQNITMMYFADENSTGEPASADNMRRILAQFDRLQLSGDIRVGREYTRINDVTITTLCFTSGTMISTPDGERKVETLRPGDLVVTRDHGPQMLRWLGMRTMKVADLAAKPKIRPVRIRAGALGHNAPARDLVVSPQHRILLQSKIVQRVFDEPQILTAAKNLLDLPGVEVAEDLTQVTYIHLLFDRHELVMADGAWSESLYLGKQAKLNLTRAQKEEIEAIFPGLLNEETPYAPARSFAKGAPTRKLVQRSLRNGQPLYAGMI